MSTADTQLATAVVVCTVGRPACGADRKYPQVDGADPGDLPGDLVHGLADKLV